MNHAEVNTHLYEAEMLYKHGEYLDALQHLAKVNNAFPEKFDGQWLMLLCRERLGRFDEACEQCKLMLNQFTEKSEQERLRTVYNRLCHAMDAA